MLSEGKKLTEKKRLREMPLLEQPITIRLKFRKVGSLQYISHLDLQRTFNRVISRACIPVWYTKGFNPHIKLVFSTPLSVGAQSVYEFLDIRIDRQMSCDELKERLNRELTEELWIEEAYIPSTEFSQIAWATYTIDLYCQHADAQLAEQIQQVLTTSPLVLLKKTKSGEKEVDIIPMIHAVKSEYDEPQKRIQIHATLRASSTEFLNPELLITGLKQKLGIFTGDPLEERYDIMRTGVMTAEHSLFR